MATLESLPPEIIQQVLLYCTTPSFLLAIRTCKTLFSAASCSRELVFYHLQRVPGIILGLRDPNLKTKELFTILRRRGAHHLYGASLTADRFQYAFQHAKFDPIASSILNNGTGIIMDFGLVLENSSDLWLLQATTNGSPRLIRVRCPYNASDNSSIAKVVNRGLDFSVLYSIISGKDQGIYCGLDDPQIIDKNGDTDMSLASTISPEKDLRTPDCAKVFYQLVHFHRDRNIPNHCKIIAPCPIEGNFLVPVDMTIRSQFQCAILWDVREAIVPSRFVQIVNYSAEVTTTRSPDISIKEEHPSYDVHRVFPAEPNQKDTFDRRRHHANPKKIILTESLCSPLPPPTNTPPAAISRLSRAISYVSDGEHIKLFVSGSIIPSIIIRAHPVSTGKTHINAGSPNIWLRRINGVDWALTTPFFMSHHTKYLPPETNEDEQDEQDDGVSMAECTISSLCLATAFISNGVISHYGLRREEEVKILCVIRAIECIEFDDCSQEVDTDRCHALNCQDTKIVARLWGWNASSSTMAGESIVASTSCGRRLAIAQWDKILVWVIEPDALIDKAQDEEEVSDDGDGYQVPFEFAPEHGARQRDTAVYYEKTFDENLQTWIVELRPIVLKSEGVVRQLRWKDIDQLLVRTDRDVHMWDLGVHGTGKKNHCWLGNDSTSREWNLNVSEGRLWPI